MASLLPSPIACDKAQGLYLRAENKGLVCKLEFKVGLWTVPEGWSCFSLHPIVTVCIWWPALPWPCKAMARGEEIILKTLMPVLFLSSSFSDHSHSLWKWKSQHGPKVEGSFQVVSPTALGLFTAHWNMCQFSSPVTKPRRCCCCPASGGWGSPPPHGSYIGSGQLQFQVFASNAPCASQQV